MFVRAHIASKTVRTAPLLVWCAAVVLPGLLVRAQPPDSEEAKQLLVRSFVQGRDAFASEDWEKASEQFREVSKQCSGSPLALESNYYATLAEWKRGDRSCHESMQAWLREAKLLQDRLRHANRPSPSSWDAWIGNMHLLLAQTERQRQQWESAESRLAALLELADSERSQDFAWPAQKVSIANAWYERGLLAQDRHQDWGKAKDCFQQALDASPDGSELRCELVSSIAKTHIQLAEWDASEESIAQLESLAMNDHWRAKAALLRGDIAKARQDAAAFAKALQPAVAWALSGRTDLQLAYELALALLEAREEEDGEAVLIHIVQRDPKHPVTIEARVHIARRAIERGAWQQAKERLDEAIAMGCAPAWIPHARLARGQAHLKLGLPASAVDDLTVALEYVGEDVGLETAIRFELGEALMQSQRWDEANEHWEFLAGRYKDSTAELPSWLARVWLHQAEMQALRQNWIEAEAIVSRIQAQFPECDCRDDVDYLKARCLISKAGFDEARQLLDRIAREPTVRSLELAARSRWMMGETFLMQRRYAEALQAYESVLETGSSSYWQSAAWMQIGQCHELLRDVPAAREAYQTLMDRYADGPFGEIAQQRLDSLGSSDAPRQSTARTLNDTPVVKQR
ncbi:MAG: tetratricopeptide repeat protein [Planctomycetota bacterium]